MMEKRTVESRAVSPGKPYFPALHTYREHGLFAIPEDVPELGVKAGDPGTIAGVYEGGRMLDVEIVRDDGTSAGFVDIRLDQDGNPHIVGHSPLDSR